MTPTKGNLFSPSRKTEVSPSHKSVTRSSTAPAQSTSLARRYAYIEDRHKALKDEYDKLRNQYQEDLKHWKEYKALEVSRVDLKKKKREARKAARLNTSQSNSGSTSKAPESTVERLVSASEGSLPLSIEQAGLATELGTTRGEEAASDQPDEGYTPDADFEGELENFAEQVQAPDSSHPPDQHSQHRPPAESDTSSRHTKPETSQMASAHAEAYAEDTSRPAITSTPKHPVSETKRHVNSASRITPWLGGQGGPPAERPPHPLKTKNDVDEDDFFDRPGASSTTISTIKAPLIRDRLGDTGPPSSLRRTALRRTVRAVSHARDSLSPTPSSSRSARKRKQVDMDGLSPAEKSMRLKELSKLPAADKRVYYAQYKGKGRYLPPEEV